MRNIFLFFLALLPTLILLLTMSFFVFAKEETPILGDVNFDGAVTAGDARFVLRLAAFLEDRKLLS